jgi:arylsulfatase A-like enzyme
MALRFDSLTLGSLSLGLLLWIGCAPDDPTALLRLGPADFESAPVSYHGAVAPIGDEARPVLVAPESEPVLSLFALAPGADGSVRANVELPPEVSALPSAAFTLQVQEFPGSATPELLEEISRAILSRQILEGWRLDRGAGNTARLVYEAGDSSAARRYSLHLRVLRPGPVRLQSTRFDVPAGGSLELAYGLTTAPGAFGFVPVHFRAQLDCEGGSERVLVDAVVEANEKSGWREAASHFDASASCQLLLSAGDSEGEAVPGAVWAVPRIVPPIERDVVAETPNLILISLDTLRADHLSGFGYPRETSPKIDAGLIARGTSFDDVTSTYSRTDVSHMSVFTGLYPEARVERGRLSAHSPVPMLAEKLRDAGFDTAAFTEDALIAGVFGFWFGFDRFTEYAYSYEERAHPIFADGIEYVRAHRDRPFFLFLHTYKTHVPYHASSDYQALFVDESEWELPGMSPVPKQQRPRADEYDRTIREADDLVGRLLDELDTLGLAERTFVVLLSDHGEAFGERGVNGHSYSGHQEVMRVPVIIRGPGVPEGVRVDTPVSLVDIVPTVLDLLGLAELETTQGISWLPALQGGALPERRSLHFSWLTEESVGVRYGAFKYKQSKAAAALFNLEDDPGERAPLAGPARRPIAQQLIADHEAASGLIREDLLRRTESVDEGSAPVTPEMEASLRALGYIE